MIGPVVHLELLQGGRRGRQYLFRWLYGGWLAVQFAFLYLVYLAEHMSWRYQDLHGGTNPAADFAAGYVRLFLVQQLIVLFLVTPAFAAGAITDEKASGTLQQLLTTHLGSFELIVGKLLGRLAQVLLLALTGLPFLFFAAVFAGVGPAALLFLLAFQLGPLFGVAAASLLASVWCRQTRDAVLAVYAAGAGGLLLLQFLPAPAQRLNPLAGLNADWLDASFAGLAAELLLSLALWGGLGIACLIVATWRLRGAYVRQLEGGGRKRKARRWDPAASLTDDPVGWRERHLEGIAPLPLLRRVPRSVAVGLVFLLTLLASLALIGASLPPDMTLIPLRRVRNLDRLFFQLSEPATTGFVLQALVALLASSLVVGIRCSGAISGEREKQTWEPLLLTPLEPRELVRGKLWGILAAARPYFVAYALPVVTLGMLIQADAYLWTLILLGVTWLAMYFVGAAGIWCSARSRSSWRSLLGTMGIGYLGGFALYLACTLPGGIVAAVLLIGLALMDEFFQIGLMRSAGNWLGLFFDVFFLCSCLALALAIFLIARALLKYAERRIEERDRTRPWTDAPLLVPRRRTLSRPPRR
jgi:ABC-type transport system involved in multi-copper enzyme maturation permease subunit